MLSFVPDTLADAAVSTKVLLMLTHVVAAAIVIPHRRPSSGPRCGMNATYRFDVFASLDGFAPPAATGPATGASRAARPPTRPSTPRASVLRTERR
ncbi:MAG: DUF6069 family protein [Pseudonocardia sp.]|nr:DUF6069 family protein [Pseudonocardia sp.]